MGFFDSVFGEEPEGKFKAIPLTAEQLKAQDFLMSLFENTPKIPTKKVTEMSDIEKEGQRLLKLFTEAKKPQILTDAMTQLSDILNTTPDVRESPGYRAFLEESERLRDLSQSDISRRGQSRTGALSFPTAREGAELDANINRNILAELGRRQELERQVKLQAIPQALNFANAETAFPLQKLTAVQQFGSLPRQLQQAQEDAIFNQALQTVTFPYQYQRLPATDILNKDRYTYQMDMGRKGITEYVNDTVGLFNNLGLGGGGVSFPSLSPNQNMAFNSRMGPISNSYANTLGQPQNFSNDFSTQYALRNLGL